MKSRTQLIHREVVCTGRILNLAKRGASVSSNYALIYKGKKLVAVEVRKEALCYTTSLKLPIII